MHALGARWQRGAEKVFLTRPKIVPKPSSVEFPWAYEAKGILHLYEENTTQ